MKNETRNQSKETCFGVQLEEEKRQWTQTGNTCLEAPRRPRMPPLRWMKYRDVTAPLRTMTGNVSPNFASVKTFSTRYEENTKNWNLINVWREFATVTAVILMLATGFTLTLNARNNVLTDLPFHTILNPRFTLTSVISFTTDVAGCPPLKDTDFLYCDSIFFSTRLGFNFSTRIRDI